MRRAGPLLGVVVAAAGLAVMGLLALLSWRLLRTPADVDADWVRTPQRVSNSRSTRPVQRPADGYVSSDACRSCHPRNYDTWHDSYHRRMTQLATPQSVVGDFDDRRVEIEGRTYHLRRRDDEFWVEMSDPDAHLHSPVRLEFPIVMTTGSHHMQIYWYPTGKARTLGQLPLVYLIPEQRWTLRKSVFLQPPAAPHSETGRWNTTCVQCHTTLGQSRPLDERFGAEQGHDTRAAEFGISCEACHGPGAGHVAFRRNADGDPPPAADPIVNPANLSPELSSQVCGQCHGVTVSLDREAMDRDMQHGTQFRPGDRMQEHRHVVSADPQTIDELKPLYPEDEIREQLSRLMWPDGMIRVVGREYNGLLQSECHVQGRMACVSCHQLHQSDDDRRPRAVWADDQLKPQMNGDEACLQCHESSSYAARRHTHHPHSSAGSRCYNCHMPHTSYGLAKAVRSHQIDSPDAAVSIRTGRPNACNLCHLDKSLQWTGERLSQWHGIPRPEAGASQQQETAAAASWALAGDAGQRALVAWSMGWAPAVEASGRNWLAPYLAELLQDPYDAVRLIAYRSLLEHPEVADLSYDFVGTPESRRQAAAEVLDRWRRLRLGAVNPRPATLIRSDGSLDRERFDALLRRRDTTPIRLAE